MYILILNVQKFMLSIGQLRSISGGKNSEFEFDLSIIPADMFKSLASAISNIGYKFITKLTISCKSSEDIDVDAVRSDRVLNSISMSVENYFAKLCNSIVEMIIKSEILESVTIMNVIARGKDLHKLTMSLGQSRSIRKIKFVDVCMNNSTVQRCLNDISQNKISSLSFRKCGLNDDVVPYFIEFINMNKKLFGNAMISHLDLSENNISQESYNRIELAIGSEFNKKLFTSDDIETQINELKEENEELRVQIERLKSLIREVRENDALFVLGDGAVALIEKMRGIDERITHLISL